MRFDFTKYLKICIGMILLSILLVLVYIPLPLIFGQGGIEATISSFIAIAIFLLVVITALIFLALQILAIVEVVTSNNSGNFKILWVLVLFFLNTIGFLLYFFFGRKDLK